MKTILCVEDNIDNLKVLQMMITRLRPNDRFMSARTAEAALLLIDKEQPDLILMDISLPGMNGLQAVSILQQQAHTKHIPVIAVSAHAMVNNIRDGMEAGCSAYVTKPVDMNALGQTIDHYLPQTASVQIG